MSVMALSRAQLPTPGLGIHVDASSRSSLVQRLWEDQMCSGYVQLRVEKARARLKKAFRAAQISRGTEWETERGLRPHNM